MLEKRLLMPSEHWYIPNKCNVQLALDVENPRKVAEISMRLVESIIGFHLRVEGDYLISKKNIVKIDAMPNQIAHVDEASEWAADSLPLDFEKSLARIACNDRFIAVSINHLCADGGYLNNIVKHIQNPKQESYGNMPLPLEDFYSKRIDKAPDTAEIVDNDPTLTRLKSRGDPKSQSQATKHKLSRVPASSLKCFKGDGKLTGLTESLWLALAMSSMAYNEEISHVGSSTCLNLRPVLGHKGSQLDVCNHYSAITAFSKVHDKSTVEEIGRELRRDFQDKYMNEGAFSYLKAIQNLKTIKNFPGVGNELTNVGPILIRSPIQNASMSISINSENCQSVLSLMSYSVISERLNEVITRLRYGEKKVNNIEADLVMKSIKWSMSHIPKEAYFIDAVHALMDYQSNIKKHFS